MSVLGDQVEPCVEPRHLHAVVELPQRLPDDAPRLYGSPVLLTQRKLPTVILFVSLVCTRPTVGVREVELVRAGWGCSLRRSSCARTPEAPRCRGCPSCVNFSWLALRSPGPSHVVVPLQEEVVHLVMDVARIVEAAAALAGPRCDSTARRIAVSEPDDVGSFAFVVVRRHREGAVVNGAGRHASLIMSTRG